MKTHLQQELGMITMNGDLECFINVVRGNLERFIGSYIADTIATCSNEFEEESKLTERIFNSKKRSYHCFSFAVIQIFKKGDPFLLDQYFYANKLQPLKPDYTFDLFQARGQELSWLDHTRPDLCVTVAFLSRLSMEKLTRAHILQLNKATDESIKWKNRELTQHKLNGATLQVFSYWNSSFAN